LVERWLFGFFWLVLGVSTARFGGFRKAAGVGWWGSGTLLGPEGTGTGVVVVFVVFRPLGSGSPGWWAWSGVRAGPASIPHQGLCCLRVLVVWWWLWVGVRSCFENCIVNASILFLLCSSFLGHTVDALASGADEGRGSLRYAPGSWQPSVDPGVSEWGNLAPVMGCCRHLNV
jgi:hypothetical protein